MGGGGGGGGGGRGRGEGSRAGGQLNTGSRAWVLRSGSHKGDISGVRH